MRPSLNARDYDIVLADLRETIAYVQYHEQDFIQDVLQQSGAEQRKATAQKRQELAQAQDKTVNVERFVFLVRRYTEVEELTSKIVNEFIKRMIIYASDKSSGKRIQKVKVIYNLVERIPMREKRTA